MFLFVEILAIPISTGQHYHVVCHIYKHFQMQQHVTEPTHYRPNTTSNILDLVLTNMINTIQSLSGINPSAFDLNYYVTQPAVKLVYLDIIYTKLILIR